MPSAGDARTSPDSVATMPGSTLATAHSTKGLEFDHVAVVDMDAGRFPSQRSLDDAVDPVRALEEERRLALRGRPRDRPPGHIHIGGRGVDDLDPGERDVAMVFQSYALYPHLSVRGNLEFPLRRARVPAPERDARVAEAVRMLALEGLLDRKPAQLSGGQMQRVALGRALVRRPRLFLFDEPLSNLDARLRAELRGEIASLHARLGVTALYVTHDQAEAMTLGTRIAVLEAGRVVQVGAPLDVFREPATTLRGRVRGQPGDEPPARAGRRGRPAGRRPAPWRRRPAGRPRRRRLQTRGAPAGEPGDRAPGDRHGGRARGGARQRSRWFTARSPVR